jgi:chorismate mutase
MDNIRKEIDRVDQEIIALLTQRFFLVSQLLCKKKRLTEPEREDQILSKIDSPYIQSVYKEIFKSSKKLLLDLGWSKNNH